MVSHPINGSLQLFSSAEFNTLSFYVTRSDTSLRPIPHATVKVNSSGTLFDFDLNEFEPRFEPYNISVIATRQGDHVYTASTQFLRLPGRKNGGCVTAIDSLYGGLLVGINIKPNQGTWTPSSLYSYYLDGNWLAEGPNNMEVLKSYGYNVLHIVPAGGLGYDFEQLDAWLDKAQTLGLWIMFDMRWQYQNVTGVEWQVNRLKARPNMLLWYTADEPGTLLPCMNQVAKSLRLVIQMDKGML